uniref:RNA-binding protein 48 n=1 Tax=Neogobius melanostomus TaxID=47308 RepID=A0A8C6T1G3_9GOBI
MCISRPKYREGRKAKAVKVYTINLESRYVMVQGVPAIGVMNELIQLCALYGTVEEYRPLDEYPAEEFTEVYLVKFQRLTSARAAKRRMDEKSFYGGVLHVCYVPEYETVEDTRQKLLDRKHYIMRTLHFIGMYFISSNLKWSRRNHSGFPLLPLPPREYEYPGYSHRGSLPTEDKMGTLHNAIIVDQSQPREQRTTSHDTHSNKYNDQPLSPQPPVRFLPRTTQLEKRKLVAADDTEPLLKDDTCQSEVFIGPKLPEPPKIDMEDDSLNTTVKRIRGTMKQVFNALIKNLIL